MPVIKSNRKFRDSLFHLLFGTDENKSFALNLFNALNGTDYKDPSLIHFNTLKNTMYVATYNDVSFVLLWTMNIWEQQSTWDPNIPFRDLGHFLYLYTEYLDEHEFDIHSRKLLHLPSPRFIVLYNGRGDYPDQILHLKNLFVNDDQNQLDLSVYVYNINGQHGTELKQKCRPLKEYQWIVEKIAEYCGHDAGNNEVLKAAIDRTLDELPESFIIYDAVMREKKKVEGMLWYEMSVKNLGDYMFDQGHEEGRTEGRNEGRNETARKIAERSLAMGMSADLVSKTTGLDKDVIEEIEKDIQNRSNG